MTLAELQYLANKAELPQKLVLDTAKETTYRFQEVWAEEKNNLFLTDHVRAAIDDHLTRIPLVKEISST